MKTVESIFSWGEMGPSTSVIGEVESPLSPGDGVLMISPEKEFSET